MNRYESVIRQLNEMINHHVEILRKEAEEYERKAYDSESYYGLNGGPSNRQRKAAENREEEIEALESLRNGNNYRKTDRLTFSYITCRSCGAVILSTSYIPRGYHECPCCGKMAYTEGSDKNTFEIIEQSGDWYRKVKDKAYEEIIGVIE